MNPDTTFPDSAHGETFKLGYAAGRAWAEGLATFDQLDALAAELPRLAALDVPFLSGFAEAAFQVRAVIDEPLDLDPDGDEPRPDALIFLADLEVTA